MTKVHPEIVPDSSNLAKTNEVELSDSSAMPEAKTPRELSTPLADFKSYVDSKFCYHSSALETAKLVKDQSKVAYKCQMKLFVETRSIHRKTEPATWHHETRLGFETLGKLLLVYTDT